jgi:Mg2+-importing ATPase
VALLQEPFNLLLTLLAVISYVTEDMKATPVIGTMVVLSVAIRFWQERKSNIAADKLKAMVSNTATVIRRDSARTRPKTPAATSTSSCTSIRPTEEVPIAQLVPGDLVALSAGDMIPADCRVLAAKDLFVSQAAMTGESLPVEKFARLRDLRQPIRWSWTTSSSWAPTWFPARRLPSSSAPARAPISAPWPSG